MVNQPKIRRWDGLVVGVSASHAVGRGFVPWPGRIKDHHKIGTNYIPAWHAGVMGRSLTVKPDSKRSGSVLNCL